MEAGSDSSSDDGAIDLEPEIVTEVRGVTLYLNDSVGANRYRGVYKQGPNRWLAKMWSRGAKKHVMIGEYATQEDAAYAYAMAKNGDRPVREEATPRSTTTIIQCSKHASCERPDRHRGTCKKRGVTRQQPKRQASMASAAAAASAASQAPPASPSSAPARPSGGKRPAARQDANPPPAGSASTPGASAAASSSTSTVDVAIELFKGIKRQREDGKITHEEGAELQKELLMAVSL